MTICEVQVQAHESVIARECLQQGSVESRDVTKGDERTEYALDDTTNPGRKRAYGEKSQLAPVKSKPVSMEGGNRKSGGTRY